MFEAGICNFFTFLEIEVYYKGLYNTKLLRRFSFVFLFKAGGFLSFKSNNRDYLISSFLGVYYSSVLSGDCLVMFANYF